MVHKILMVCLGNICRSPLAEGILQSKLNRAYTVDSAGTGDWHEGEMPDNRSVTVAKNHGIDISNQRARQIRMSDFDEFDLILAMDTSNYNNLLNLTKTKEHRMKIRMITNSNVPDPYYGDLADFENVYQILDKATDELITELNLL